MSSCFQGLTKYISKWLCEPDLNAIVCGPSESGKSSLISRLHRRPFSQFTVPTNSPNKQRFFLNEFLVEFTDFGGQRCLQDKFFGSLEQLKRNSVIVIVIDYMEYVNKDAHYVSTNDFQQFKSFIKRTILATQALKIPILVVGTKLDLVIDKYQKTQPPSVTISKPDNGTSFPRSKSTLTMSTKTNALMSKQTVQQNLSKSRKKSVLFLQTLFSLNQLANDLDISIQGEDQDPSVDLKLSENDFNDLEISSLCETLNISPNETVNLDSRDFGIILTSLKNDGDMDEISDWLLGDCRKI